jgi:hypothetical protein
MSLRLGALVSPEQRAYVEGVYSYIMGVYKAGAGLFGGENTIEDDRKSLIKEMKTGKLTLNHFIDERMASILEKDEKAKTQSGQ